MPRSRPGARPRPTDRVGARTGAGARTTAGGRDCGQTRARVGPRACTRVGAGRGRIGPHRGDGVEAEERRGAQERFEHAEVASYSHDPSPPGPARDDRGDHRALLSQINQDPRSRWPRPGPGLGATAPGPDPRRPPPLAGRRPTRGRPGRRHRFAPPRSVTVASVCLTFRLPHLLSASPSVCLTFCLPHLRSSSAGWYSRRFGLVG